MKLGHNSSAQYIQTCSDLWDLLDDRSLIIGDDIDEYISVS